jgi:hypothetical protein
VFFQELKRRRVTFILAERDASEYAMNDSEHNLWVAGRVCANRLLM